MNDKEKQIEELTNIIMTIQTIYHEKASSEQIAQGLVNANYQKVNGNTSDGYHTFNELYHHRAVLFSVICNNYKDLAWKSKKHHDGTMYDGMFIVGIDTPQGQATYHYDIEPYWDMFKVKELYAAPLWDGHTPQQAIERIGNFAPKIPKGSVVLSKEEYEGLQIDKDFNYGYHEGEKNMEAYYENIKLPDVRNQARKQAVKEVLERLREEIYHAIKSNHRAVTERIHKHNICIAKDDFCQRCNGKVEALQGLDNEIDEIAKKFGVEIGE